MAHLGNTIVNGALRVLGGANIDTINGVTVGNSPKFTDNNTTYSAGTGISLSGTTFNNSGVRSVATGASNGTVNVNTNGSTADVAVKGLGAMAYKASVSKSDVGLGNVANYDQSKAIKSITRSGTTFTATALDGTTSSFTQQDNNTTYTGANGVSLSGTTFSNSGVRSIATGTSNGTINVNTNGSTANVAVKGLGDRAYDSTSYLPLAGGTLTGRVTTTKPNTLLITGSGTAAQDKGSGVSPRYFPAKWTFNTGVNPTNGDMIEIKIPVAGHDYGIFLSINNGSTYHPVAVGGQSRLTTHYASGVPITLVYQSDGQVNDIFALAGGDARTNVSGGCWRVVNFYDSGNTYPSAYCTTAAATAAKAATCSGYNLTNNSYIHIIMTQTNSSASALTLNINGKGAKAIYINGSASSSSNYTLPAGSYLVYYNGTNYYFRTDGKITGAGIVDIGGNTGKFLRGDGTWQTPTNTTYTGANGVSLSGTTFSNSGVRSIATGTTAGTINVNTNGSTANVAVKDAASAIKNITRSGTTFTATKLDGSTFSFTQQDNNTTYSNATTAAAGLMSAADKIKLNNAGSFSKKRYTITASSWSNSTDSNGYYTYTLTLTTGLSTSYPPNVYLTGSSDSTFYTDTQKEMYSYLEQCNLTATTTLVLYAKTKPDNNFYIFVEGQNT